MLKVEAGWPETPRGQQWRKAGMTPGHAPEVLTPHPIFTGDPGWAEAPIQPPGLSCCSNKFFEGAALSGGWAALATLSSSARGKMRQLQGPLPLPPTKRRPEESERPIVAPGPPPGAPGLHPRDRAAPPRLHRHPIPAPQGGHLQWQPPPTHPQGRGMKMLHLEGTRPHSLEGVNQSSSRLFLFPGLRNEAPHGGRGGV